MIAAATAVPMPETGPSVNSNWIKANAIAASIYAAVGILTFVTDKLLAIGDPTTAMMFRGIAAAIALAGTIAPIVAYAMLTGAVLGEKLPKFSKRGWISMHGSIGARSSCWLPLPSASVRTAPASPVPSPCRSRCSRSWLARRLSCCRR